MKKKMNLAFAKLQDVKPLNRNELKTIFGGSALVADGCIVQGGICNNSIGLICCSGFACVLVGDVMRCESPE